MNRPAQRKVLIILIVLLFLSLGGLGYWYFFINKCGTLPKEYMFLDTFVTKNKCTESEYAVRGIIYNIREEGQDVLFDFNAWDVENKESLYYENIRVRKDSLSGEFAVMPNNFGAVEMNIKLEKNIFKSNDSDIVAFNVEKLGLTEERYNEIFSTVYDAITKSPMAYGDFDTYHIYTGEGVNAVFTEVLHRDLYGEISFGPPQKYFPDIYDGFTNKLLYRPWILSFLYTERENLNEAFDVSIEEIREMLLWDYDKYRNNILEMADANSPNCASVEGEADTPDVIDKNKYQTSNSFACLMIYQISNNLNLKDEDIINKYCNLEFFENSIDDYIKETVLTDHYSLQEYLGLLNSEILIVNDEGRDSGIHSSNTTSILADSYGARKLWSTDSVDDLNEQVNFVIDYILDYGLPYLKNICSIAYFTSFTNNDDTFASQEVNTIYDKTGVMLEQRDRKILELMEDDIYASLLCIESYSNYNEEVDKLIEAQIQKIINLYFFNDEEIRGIWKEKEYDIRTNARFLKSFLSLY